MLNSKMFVSRFTLGFKKEKRAKDRRVDVVNEQVKQVLGNSDQKLILMVRG